MISPLSIWSSIGIDLSLLTDFLNFKVNWTSSKFSQIEGNSNGFIVNLMSFIFSNLIITFGMFCVLRLIFTLLDKLKFEKMSLFLKEYSFWITLYVMLTEGNIQYFTYLLCFEIDSIFSFTFVEKINNVCVITLPLLFLFLSIFVYFQISQVKNKSDR